VDTFSAALIDDDFFTRNMFELILAHHNVPVVTFPCPFSAAEYLQTKCPDVIVLDLFLEGVSGYDVLLGFRKQAPSARIVATTAYHFVGTSTEALLRGFDGYIPKPLSAEHLIGALSYIAGRGVAGKLKGDSIV